MKTVKNIYTVTGKAGKLRCKVTAGKVDVGDILKSINVNLPDYRVTGLGKEWTEGAYIDSEDMRSFGGGQGTRVQTKVQYAYVEVI